MAIPLSLTLSFADLELLVLVDDGGTSPLEVEESLAMDRRDTRAVYGDLLSPDLLDWHAKAHTPGSLPWP